MKKTRILSALLVVALTVLGGCNTEGAVGSSGDQITVVFVPKVTGNAFFESANDGVQIYAQARGFRVLYQGSESALVQDQIDIVRRAIGSGADAICISSLDPVALDDVLREAMDAGVKVTTWDADVSGDARSVMVSQGTPDQLGKMLVEMGAKSLASRGLDPTRDPVRYAWHYSQPAVADQNSWREAGETYIRSTYPGWTNVYPDNYYSEQDPQLAVQVGRTILEDHPDIDLIICNDSTSLPGQAQAAQDMGLSAKDVTITGFASPNAMRDYCKAGIVERWGLWDCRIQGSLGCYLAYYLASGNEIQVGDRLDVPEIGVVEIMPNTVLDPSAYTSQSSGVVLLPDRVEFTAANVDNYDF